jgi:hypothetical protein
MRIVLAFAFCLFGSAAASAGFQDGNTLYTNCKDEKNSNSVLLCYGYIMGVADMTAFEDAVQKKCVWFALPNGVNPTQLRDVVLKYLVANPEIRHYDASFLVRDALTGGFPCGK